MKVWFRGDRNVNEGQYPVVEATTKNIVIAVVTKHGAKLPFYTVGKSECEGEVT